MLLHEALGKGTYRKSLEYVSRKLTLEVYKVKVSIACREDMPLSKRYVHQPKVISLLIFTIYVWVVAAQDRTERGRF